MDSGKIGVSILGKTFKWSLPEKDVSRLLRLCRMGSREAGPELLVSSLRPLLVANFAWCLLDQEETQTMANSRGSLLGCLSEAVS